MENHSQISDSGEARGVLEDQIRNCYGRVVYTHKAHEKCCDYLLNWLSKIKLGQIALSALTTGGFVTIIFGADKLGMVLGVCFSTSLFAINVYIKDYDLGELAQKHKQAANEIWLIRENYLSLLTDLVMGGEPIETLANRRDALLKDLSVIYAGSPAITFRGYKKAQKALKVNEDMTFSDKEIDAFLPSGLKKK